MDTAVAPIGHPPLDPQHSSGWRRAVSGTGQLFITVGIVILLFVAYELWWTGLTTRHDQHALRQQLEQEWHAGKSPASPALGTGIAILRIPRLGKSYNFVVVQGTSTADLIKGPGHYPGTAMPGQVGNFAVAGHRTTYAHPFFNINELRPGDAIVIETRTTWFTYTVDDLPGSSSKYQEIVSPSDVSVAYPVPDQSDPSAAAKRAVITLTSCNPRYSASQRIVVHGVLTSKLPTSAGLPPALGGSTAARS